MKKFTKVLFVNALTFSFASAGLLGAVSFAGKEALNVHADGSATVTIKNLEDEDVVLTDQQGKTISQVLQGYSFETTTETEYLIGIATKPMSEFERPYDFYYEAEQLYYSSTVVNSDITLYAEWGSSTPEWPTFTILPNKHLEKNSSAQNLGEVSVSNLPIKSVFNEEPFVMTNIYPEFTNLVNVADSSNVIPLTFYYAIHNVKAISYGAGQHHLYDADYDYEGYSSVVGSRDFVYIDSTGTEEDANNFADLIAGKVVLVNRGEVTFATKGNNLAAKNPLAIICINNSMGSIAMNLDSYTSDIPYYSANISLKDAIKENATKNTKSGTDYYTGNFEFLSGTYEEREEFDMEQGISFFLDPDEAHYRLYCGYDSSLLVEGAIYKAEITYSVQAVNSYYEEYVPLHELEEKTTLLVGDVELQSISLSGSYPTKFVVGDTFSYEGLVVTAHYQGTLTVDVIDYVVTSPDMSTPGTKTVTVTYTENFVTKSATYQIKVAAKAAPVQPKAGLPAGAIVAIVLCTVLVVSVGGFAIFWFVIKKKTWADFVAVFKKK